MRFQSLGRVIANGLIAVTGLMLLSINLNARSAPAQATATPPLTSTPITGVPITYTVKSGDSFNTIARQFNLTHQQLQALNTISNPSLLRVGQVLIVAVSTFTPTPAPTETSTPTPTLKPTVTPTRKPVPAPRDQPTAIPASKSIAPPAPRSPVGIPPDVILAGAVIVFSVIGLIVGFRTQRG